MPQEHPHLFFSSSLSHPIIFFFLEEKTSGRRSSRHVFLLTSESFLFFSTTTTVRKNKDQADVKVTICFLLEGFLFRGFSLSLSHQRVKQQGISDNENFRMRDKVSQSGCTSFVSLFFSPSVEQMEEGLGTKEKREEDFGVGMD